jgi:hypothetical protein
MKGGANDYLMKTRLNWLGPAVKRELEETALKQEKMCIESILSKTESRFKRLIQDLIDVVWLSDETGKKLYTINAAFEKIFELCPMRLKMNLRDGKPWLLMKMLQSSGNSRQTFFSRE